MKKGRTELKCQGRFSDFRRELEHATEILVEDDPNYKLQTVKELEEILELIVDPTPFDPRDPYFSSHLDCVRDIPFENGTLRDRAASLVPLLTEEFVVSPGLLQPYLTLFQPNDAVIDNARLFFNEFSNKPKGVSRLGKALGFDLSKVHIPELKGEGYARLPGYFLVSGFGLGPNDLGSMVYDAPFYVELHKVKDPSVKNLEREKDSGVLGISFWVNTGNEMLLAQIQHMRGESLPPGVDPGITGYVIAESVAKAMGFETISSYSANTHPQFRMYPSSKARMHNSFHELFDRSATRLGYAKTTGRNGCGQDQNQKFMKRLK